MNTKKESLPKFNRENLVSCQEFADKRDIVMAVLREGVTYTKDQARQCIAEFLKRKVDD